MLKYLYLDESGDLGNNGSKYLILAALLADNPITLDRIIKKMRRNIFKKELNGAYEIKGNKSSDKLRMHMLSQLNRVIGAKIFCIVVEKNRYFNNKVFSYKHKFYNHVAGMLAKNIILCNIDIDIRIDKSKGRQLLQQEFNECFIKNLKEGSNLIKTKINHSYSHCWSGLQFADIIAWSYFQKFEYGNSKYVDLITIDREVYFI